MMMKTFGAVLIVSRGYLIGRIRVAQEAGRLKALRAVETLFKEYDSDLRRYRRSLSESLKGKGGIAEAILEGAPIKDLRKEEQLRLNSAVNQLQNNASFQESLEISGEFLHWLESAASKLEEDHASQKKALPLLTAAIGLLIAVLLY